jgi:hypothetical protein
MIVLFKKDGMLYAKVLMDLRLPIPHKNRVFGKGKSIMKKKVINYVNDYVKGKCIQHKTNINISKS